jgi:RNAse (barnase) inhibitor barstar
MRTPRQRYILDGRNFSTLEEFYDEVSRVLIPGAGWGENLDAFNDILRGGFGTPEDGFILEWKYAAVSRERLGYPETVRQLERRLLRCHPENRLHVAEELKFAREGKGQTAYDWLVEIILDHREGGDQRGSIELDLHEGA